VSDDHLLVKDAHALGRDNGGQVVEEVLKVSVVLVIRLATVHTGHTTRGSGFVFHEKSGGRLNLDPKFKELKLILKDEFTFLV
jgi:hypothetical protein